MSNIEMRTERVSSNVCLSVKGASQGLPGLGSPSVPAAILFKASVVLKMLLGLQVLGVKFMSYILELYFSMVNI